MRILLAATCSIQFLCAAHCDPQALLNQLTGVRAQLEQNHESQARSQFKQIAKQAAPCAEDVRAGNTLADLAIRLHQPKDALKFAKIVEQASSREFGPRSIEHAVSLETLTQALAMNRREIEAEPYLREAMSIADEHGGQTSMFKVSLLNLLGTLHSRLNDPEGAQRQFERAWEIVKYRPDEQLRVVVLHNLAAAALRQGHQEEARARLAEVQQDLHRLPPSLQREIKSWSPVTSLRQP